MNWERTASRLETGLCSVQSSVNPHKAAFVESFVLKTQRERALELLASSKNRHKFTGMFDHHGRNYITEMYSSD